MGTSGFSLTPARAWRAAQGATASVTPGLAAAHTGAEGDRYGCARGDGGRDCYLDRRNATPGGFGSIHTDNFAADLYRPLRFRNNPDTGNEQGHDGAARRGVAGSATVIEIRRKRSAA